MCSFDMYRNPNAAPGDEVYELVELSAPDTETYIIKDDGTKQLIRGQDHD